MSEMKLWLKFLDDKIFNFYDFPGFQSLPFMEYELHCQLQNKLKVKGMNTLFGLKVQVVVGERMLVAVAVSTHITFFEIQDFLCFSIGSAVFNAPHRL